VFVLGAVGSLDLARAVVVCGEGQANEDALQDGPEKLGRGEEAVKSSAETRVGIAPAQRPKTLGPKDSGVYRAFHSVGESVAANDPQGGEFSPGIASTCRLRSVAQTVARAELVAALMIAMHAAGASDADVGAAIDESPQRVAKIRGGELPLKADHLVLLARRMPGLFEDLVREMRGAK
jgi:hypothetical protein